MGSRAFYDSPITTEACFSPDLKKVLETEFSERFVNGMRNRMIVSFCKYGKVSDGFPDRVDAIASLESRIRKYKDTGNVEWLIDAANFAMIEFMHPRLGNAHFRPTDSHESPGRVRDDGVDEHGKNTPVDTALEKLKEKYANGSSAVA